MSNSPPGRAPGTLARRAAGLWLLPLALGAGGAAGQVQDDPGQPLSAIEWLSKSYRRLPPPADTARPPPARGNTAGTTGTAETGTAETGTIGGVRQAMPAPGTPPAYSDGGPPLGGVGAPAAPSAAPSAADSPGAADPGAAEAPLPAPSPPASASAPVDAAEPAGGIEVTPLADIRKDAVGLLPPSVSGLPRDFWGPSSAPVLAGLIAAQPATPLPALQDLLYRILLAELDAPALTSETAPPTSAEATSAEAAGADGERRGAVDGTLLLARIDRLLALGALEPAHALLERAGPTTGPSGPALFRRWFDVSLLMGHGDHACTAMAANPGLAPSLKARVFCLARGGDWNAAAVTLATGERLGFIAREDADLLARFLDPELNADEPVPPPPEPMTALDFVMREALALPRPPGALPLAFAHADLREGTPWRSRLQAAERLTRSGALPPATLIGLYTERKPAASGGIWERVRAVTAFDVALLAGDPQAIAATLPPALAAMEAVALEVAFARHYAERLVPLPLPAAAAARARVLLLSDSYESAAPALRPADPRLAFARGLALGAPAGLELPESPQGPRLGRAIAAAFLDAPPESPLFALLAEGRLGEAILRAMLLLKDGSLADPGDIRTALALFRAVGLEDIARRTAIQLVLLERRG